MESIEVFFAFTFIPILLLILFAFGVIEIEPYVSSCEGYTVAQYQNGDIPLRCSDSCKD